MAGFMQDATGRTVVGPRDGGPDQSRQPNQGPQIFQQSRQRRPVVFTNVGFKAGTMLSVYDQMYRMPRQGSKFQVAHEHAKLLMNKHGLEGKITHAGRKAPAASYTPPAGFKLVPVDDDDGDVQPQAAVPERVQAEKDMARRQRSHAIHPTLLEENQLIEKNGIAADMRDAEQQAATMILDPAFDKDLDMFLNAEVPPDEGIPEVPDDFVEMLTAAEQEDEVDDILDVLDA